MDSQIMHIGQRIRRLRREKKMTLLQVATQAKLSVGFMSQVERNLNGISISSLATVANALGVPLGFLLDHPRQDQPDSHQGSRQTYTTGETQQRYERLSTSFEGSLLNAVKVLMPVSYRSEWVAHGGDELVYVLSGRIRYTIGKKDYVLGPGDSLHFDAHTRHRVANDGDAPAELIGVNTLPLFDDSLVEFAAARDESMPGPRIQASKQAGKVDTSSSAARSAPKRVPPRSIKARPASEKATGTPKRKLVKKS